MGVVSRERLALAALLSVLLALLLREASITGVTMDEPSHMLGAHFYWKGGAVYHLPDLAPLLKILTGWVPSAFGLDIPPPSDPRWQTRDEWGAAANWAVDLKDPFFARLTRLFRLPLLLFPLAAVYLLWRWGRELGGPLAGFTAAAIFAFEPTALGHGALLKNDVAAAFAYLAFWYTAWCYWQRPGLRAAAWLGAAALLGVLAKLSLIVLAGIAPLILLTRQWRRFPARVAVLSGIVYFGLCTAYQWNVRLLHPVEIVHKWADPKIPWLFTATGQVFQWIPVPDKFWEGCIGLLWSSSERPAIYLLGAVHHEATPWYFLVALAVKVPVAFQLLFLGAAIFCLRQRDALSFFLLFPPALYIALASLAGHQLGIRLILPALPFAALMAARFAVHWRRVALVAVALGAMEAMMYFPHGISFFNAFAGGPANGLRYLADSNLDWGQDLPALRRWVSENNAKGLHLSYFGADTPWRYFTDKEIVFNAPPWNDALAKGRTVWTPEPGIYAISATLLPGHFFKTQYENYYRFFRDRAPDARVGWSIYIYDLRSFVKPADPNAGDSVR